MGIFPSPFTYTITGHKLLDQKIKKASNDAVYEWLEKRVKTKMYKRVRDRKITYDAKGNERWGSRSMPGAVYKSHKAYPGFRARIKTRRGTKDNEMDIGYIPGTIDKQAEALGDQLEYGGNEPISQWLANQLASGGAFAPSAWAARNAMYAATYAKAQAAAAARRHAKQQAAKQKKHNNKGPARRSPGWGGQRTGGHRTPPFKPRHMPKPPGRKPGWAGGP